MFLLFYRKRDRDDQLGQVDEIVQLCKTQKYAHRVQFVDGCVTTLRKYLPVREGGFEWAESVNVHHGGEIPNEGDYILYTGLPDLTLHLHLITYLNLVHCDIKPHNILINEAGHVKVADFGIARAVSAQTMNAQAVGSVHYISPEARR